MARYTDLMATSTSVATAETAMTGSPYAPKKNGRLKKVKITLSNTAATSLIEGGYIKLTCPAFGGVDLYFPFLGTGLHTAPAQGVPIWEHDCDVMVQTGVNIAAYIFYNTTPVTPIVSLYGEFEG